MESSNSVLFVEKEVYFSLLHKLEPPFIKNMVRFGRLNNSGYGRTASHEPRVPLPQVQVACT